jgi:hypothetical protein
VIVSTFGPEGRTKCSGLDVARYDADSLHEQFGVRFRLVDSTKEMPQTLSLPKMLSGASAFEISDIQEAEAEGALT